MFAATHFFSEEDHMTKKFQAAADDFVQLSPSRDEAIEQLLSAELDVLVYPELGMDEWMMTLAFQRMAPIQCMFWGHPVTTGLDSIDYFISSGTPNTARGIYHRSIERHCRIVHQRLLRTKW